MTLYFIIGGLALCLICAFLLVWYANSAGKTKAENKAFKREIDNAKKIQDMRNDIRNNIFRNK